MTSLEPGRRDVLSRQKKQLRRCKHFSRNKCIDCQEPDKTEENCDIFGQAENQLTRSKQERHGPEFQDNDE